MADNQYSPAEVAEALQHVLPYVHAIALTPEERRLFYPALEMLRATAGWPDGPGPYAGREV